MRNSPLFRGFEPADLERLMATAIRRDVAADEVLLEAGAENGSLFVLLAGEVKVEMPAGGEDLPLALLEPGKSFGEASLIGAKKKATARVVASEASSVLELSAAALESLRDTDPLLWGRFWRNLAIDFIQRLSATNELVQNYAEINRSLLNDPDFRDYYSRI